MPWSDKDRSFSFVRRLSVLFVFLFYCAGGNCAEDSNKELNRLPNHVDSTGFSPLSLKKVVLTESIGFAGGMSALYFLWYKNVPLVPLHSFDDANEWLQMDKAGHFTTAALLSDYSNNLYLRAGVEHRKSAFISAAQGLFFLTTMELLDGFSRDWGFSWSDMGANALGSGAWLAQQLAWKEQRVSFKFSAHITHLADYRPEVLGKGFFPRLLKDYNGQTYWASVNPFAFFSDNNERRFSWINIALGYGAQGMLGGKNNPAFNSAGERLPDPERIRQFYFSLDVDWKRIPVKNRYLKSALRLLYFVKLPFPALILENGRIGFQPFYF